MAARERDVFTPAPTAAVVVDPEAPLEAERPTPQQELVGHVMARVIAWRHHRDSLYKGDWDSFYRIWRGVWAPEDKNRKSERSKLISPASMMAVDLAVAEIVEAIFGRDYWFDIPDDVEDEEKQDAERARDLLMQDLHKDGVIRQITEVVLNGALYGTGIAKIVTDVATVYTPRRGQDGKLTRTAQEKVKVYPVAIEPGQLVVDPAGTLLDDMEGAAVEMRVPLHRIHAKQRAGTYRRDVDVGVYAQEPGTEDRRDDLLSGQDNSALITEWHGLVPKRMLLGAQYADDDVAALLAQTADEELVEAVVTIANEGVLLRAIPNPSVMEDRAILAYQHSQVPNRFWGRGVLEKAKHPQKALDAEMRSRVDSLAWISNPMIAGDLTKLPARMDLNVWPGKFWPTKGPPGESLSEFRFGDVNASTFQHTQELERQLQQATGALDSVMSIRGNIRDETATGSAMAASGFIKRSKLTMLAIETFLGQLLERIMWRKMQFEPDRYPQDYKFQVKGTIGMMAREIEQQFMVNLLQFAEQGTPPYLLILKAIFEQSSSPIRTELRAAIDQMMQPPDPQAQALAEAMKQAQAQLVIEEVRNTQADTALKLANAGLSGAKELLTRIEADLKDDQLILENLKVIIDKEETSIMQEQNQISREKLEVDREKVAAQKAKASAGGGA